MYFGRPLPQPVNLTHIRWFPAVFLRRLCDGRHPVPARRHAGFSHHRTKLVFVNDCFTNDQHLQFSNALQVADDGAGEQGQFGSLSLPALREKTCKEFRSEFMNALYSKYLKTHWDASRTVAEGRLDGARDALRQTGPQPGWRKMVRPSTIVNRTRPLTGRSSNGAFFDFERKSSGQICQG